MGPVARACPSARRQPLSERQPGRCSQTLRGRRRATERVPGARVAIAGQPNTRPGGQGAARGAGCALFWARAHLRPAPSPAVASGEHPSTRPGLGFASSPLETPTHPVPLPGGCSLRDVCADGSCPAPLPGRSGRPPDLPASVGGGPRGACGPCPPWRRVRARDCSWAVSARPLPVRTSAPCPHGTRLCPPSGRGGWPGPCPSAATWTRREPSHHAHWLRQLRDRHSASSRPLFWPSRPLLPALHL